MMDLNCFAEGPCLLHSTNGELLRTLRTPSASLHPLLIKISNDRYVTVNYSPNDKSHLATFTINGEFLREVGIDDELGVCMSMLYWILHLICIVHLKDGV